MGSPFLKLIIVFSEFMFITVKIAILYNFNTTINTVYTNQGTA